MEQVQFRKVPRRGAQFSCRLHDYLTDCTMHTYMIVVTLVLLIDPTTATESTNMATPQLPKRLHSYIPSTATIVNGTTSSINMTYRAGDKEQQPHHHHHRQQQQSLLHHQQQPLQQQQQPLFHDQQHQQQPLVHHQQQRGLLHKFWYKTSTVVVRVMETVTKYFTCTRSFPDNLKLCEASDVGHRHPRYHHHSHTATTVLPQLKLTRDHNHHLNNQEHFGGSRISEIYDYPNYNPINDTTNTAKCIQGHLHASQYDHKQQR
ncbi:hypothetical protein Pmani_014543 [Petrolisthes manimaculis]|uniref:Uncharacterized protein n=1 Tax=Petrolisthes manimaculis TaxID=1843537 RepID=A0AAE1PU57_9EUCA|nr:hypothetical protein Pmani_014543 [Petrolisthes manimaculis]